MDDQRPFLYRKQKPNLFVGFFLCRLLSTLPAPLHPGPRLEAIPPLKLLFKTKVYSVCWWQDPLLPLPQGLGVLPTSPLLYPPPKEKGEGRILGCFLGTLQTPAEDQVPIVLGVWILADSRAGEVETPQTPYGGPTTQGHGLGVGDAQSTLRQPLP